MKKFILIIFVFYLILITGCVRTLQPEPGQNDVPGFIPPTLLPATPTPLPTINTTALAVPSSNSSCTDLLSFLKDVTVPDGTIVQPGASIDKQWEIQNTGTCNWGEGYTIQLIGGAELGAEKIQSLYPARSNSIITIRIEFKAPGETGNYRTAWQAFNPGGNPFGDPFYMEIIVAE
jgi:hypothetical protein